MKLIVSINDEIQLDILKDYVDGFVVGLNKFTAYSSSFFCCEKILLLAEKYEIYVLINAFIHQNEIEEFKATVSSLIHPRIHYIVGELGAVRILKSLGLENRTIYNPETMITNYMDAQAYSSSLDGIGISNEITLSDASLICNKINNGFYLAFGYHPMYRSYRKILSLYKEEKNMEFDNKNLSLREETRTSFFPIVQNDRESVIFRGGVISYLGRLEELKNMKYLFLDNIFIENEKFNEVCKIFSLLIRGKILLEKALEEYRKLDLIEDNTFIDHDSRYEVA